MSAPLRTMLHAAADLADDAHKSLIEAVEVLELAGISFTTAAADEVAELLDDTSRFVDTLADLAAGRAQRHRPDPDMVLFAAALARCPEWFSETWRRP